MATHLTHCREGVLLVMNLEHLVPSERPFAWLGVLRPSEACAGVLAKLGAAAAPATRDRLQALQVWALVSADTGFRWSGLYAIWALGCETWRYTWVWKA